MNRNEELRIAVVVDVCDGNKSGGARSASRFVEELAKKHVVHVVTTGKPAPRVVAMPGFYVPLARHLMQGMDFMFAWPQRQPLESLFGQVDIVHIYLPFLLGFRSLHIARRLGVPVVGGYHVQPENLLYNVHLRSARLARCLNRFLVSRFYNHCAAVVCPSSFAESELKRHGLRRPSFVISNGLPPQFKPPAVRRPAPGRTDFTVLTVGRLGREKRHDVLLRAVSLSRHRARLKVVISGKGPTRAQIVRMGRRLPNPPQVMCATDEELLGLYGAADLYVHASEVELEGMSVLEAMGCGLPVLIADAKTSAAKQFAADERSLFKSNDPQALAARLDYWVEHPRELAASQEYSRRLAERHALTDSVRQLEEVYHACVSRGRAAQSPKSSQSL